MQATHKSPSRHDRETGLVRLREALPPRSWIDDPADAAPYLVDWRGLYRGCAPIVLRPGSTTEVATANPQRPAARARRPKGPGACGGRRWRDGR